MNQIKHLLFFCAGLLSWTACATEDNRNESLQQAIQMVDNNPQKALQLLENISDPELLDKDNYMRYVVTLKQAQYMDYQDITSDSIILDVQRYFVETQDYEMAARASFYSAAYWDEKGIIEKVLDYSLFAHHFAQLAENNLFNAKAKHWIGSTYYDLELLDSAKVYYQKAQEFYIQEPNTEVNQLDLINMLGQIYIKQLNWEQAGMYFDSGLKAACELNNTEYEARFLHNKGVVLRERKEYPQAKEYFDQALAKTPATEDSLRIYLSYAKLYKATNQPDSTIHYLNRVKNRMAEITYPHTRRAIYKELAAYYEKEGDIPKMKHYTKLATIEDHKISNSQNEETILLITKKAKQQIQANNKSYHLVILLVIFAVGVVMVLGWHFFRKQIVKLKNRYEKLRQNHLFQNMDINRFLLGGLRRIAKSMDILKQEKKGRSLPYTYVGEEFQMLRESFNAEIAELTGKMIKRYPNGVVALPKLCSDDLCILRLTQMKYSDASIGWMLGYKANIENFVEARKQRMRQIMAESGMKVQDINLLFLPIIPV